MKAAATTLVTVLRGTETDVYADEVDSDIAEYVDVPASIIEENRRTFLPAEGAFRVVRSYSAQLGREVDVRKDDRLRDQSTGRIYLVTELSDPLGLPGEAPDWVLTLSRTS